MPIQVLAPVLAALAGVFVGGFVSELRVALEMRRERKKALNRVLWCQFDLWHDLERYDLKDIVDLFVTKFAARLPPNQAAALVPETHRHILADIVGGVVGTSRRSGLETDYDSAVEALALYDPLLAVQLSGKTALTQHRVQTDAYVAAVIETFGSPLDDTSQVEQLRPWLYKENLDTARQILRKDIESVARNLSKRQWKAVRRSLVALKERVTQEHEKMMDEGITRLINQSLLSVPSAAPHSTTSADS